ncbi:hypothetical protein DXG03_002282 [Asterophora parasitica]|uniref:Uncharacterized protein n=1 Tax=Asterophora parasitica TaxID=117018 RepID=A0A9P7K7F4_9AGAR|nr:hypothetical protein DXG03_002282 [Asterophora parasitica]
MKFTQPIFLAAIVFAAASAALPVRDNFEINAREHTVGAIAARALVGGAPFAERSFLSQGLKFGKSLFVHKHELDAATHHSRAFSDEDVHLYQRSVDEQLYDRSYTEADADLHARGVDDGIVQRNRIKDFLKKIAKGIKKGFQKLGGIVKSAVGLRRDGSFDIDTRENSEELYSRSEELVVRFDEDAELHARGVDDGIVQRNKFKDFFKKIGKGFQKLGGIAKSVVGLRRDGSFDIDTRENSEELYSRSEELVVRFDEDDILSRSDEDELFSRSEELFSRDLELEY